jgi:hypothetical protein
LDVELIDSRAAIAGISFDRQEYLWSISRGPGASIFATSVAGETNILSANWLAGRSIRGFALSPEGSKVALLVQGSGGAQVLVSGVVRDSSGQPIELADPIRVASEATNPIAVSWVDQLTLATVNTADGSNTAVLTTIGGTSRTIPALAGTKAIVAAGAGSQLYLLTETGELFSYRGSTWSPLRKSIRAVAVFN